MIHDTYLGLPIEFWFSGPLGLPFHLWTLELTLMGLLVGSFLNVVIYRMPLGKSVVRPPSHCPNCEYRIPIWLNLPIISWIQLRGRCAQCHAPISPRYLVVEAITGAAFLMTWLAWGHVHPGQAGALCVLWAGLIAATWIDLEHYIIPDEITLGGVGAGFILSALAPALQGVETAVLAMRRSGIGAVVGALVVYAVLRFGKLLFGRLKIALEPGSRVVFHETGVLLPEGNVPYEEIFYRPSDAVVCHGERVELSTRSYANQPVRLELLRNPPRLRIGNETMNAEEEPWMAVVTKQITVPREAMGMGDVKLMAGIGAFLGWEATVFSLLGSALLGSVVGLGLIAIGRRDWQSRLPYGPFIAVAAVIWQLAGHSLTHWWIFDIMKIQE